MLLYFICSLLGGAVGALIMVVLASGGNASRIEEVHEAYGKEIDRLNKDFQKTLKYARCDHEKS